MSTYLILFIVSFLLGVLYGEKKQVMKQFAWKNFTAKQFDKELVTFKAPPSLTSVDPSTKKGSSDSLFFVDRPNDQSPILEVSGLDLRDNNSWENPHFVDLNNNLPGCLESANKYPCINLGLIQGSNNDPIELKISKMIPDSIVWEVCISEWVNSDSCYLSVKSSTKNFAIKMRNDPLIMCNYNPIDSWSDYGNFEQILSTITQ